MRIEEFIGEGKTEVANGMLCTVHYYSDSEPFKVVRVSASGKTCWIRKLKVESPKNSEIGHQDWIITDDFAHPDVNEPDNSSYFKVTLRKNGAWRTVGSSLYVRMGIAQKYYDWSF